MAGFAASGFAQPSSFPLLALSAACLYAGGITWNDVCDADLDAQERPERPIPSGRVSLGGAAWFGFVLLAAGVAAALLRSLTSGAVALSIAALAITYDAWGKHTPLGPLNMAACRGLSFLLGLSAAPSMIPERGWLAVIPVVYIAAITILSRGEVHGGSRAVATFSLACIAGVIAAIALIGLTIGFSLLAADVFLAYFAWRVLPPFARAAATPNPATIRGAVKAGILSLIVLDAAVAAGYGGVFFGLAVFSLSFVAAFLARRFAVT
jgi:4-hydroxybenzoate polyprenyltransferase